MRGMQIGLPLARETGTLPGVKPGRPPRLRSFDPLSLPRMVMRPFRNRLQFLLESLLLSGTSGRLALAAALLAAVAAAMGVVGFVAAAGTAQEFGSLGEAVWWAFLRLSDPGYLGDDEGILLRTVSTIVTIAGYVLFLGVLVAILTQGLNEKIRQMEMGLTPVSARNHLIFLGWSSRIPGIMRNLVLSEQRVRRFLRRVGARQLKMVILVDEVKPIHSLELRNYLGQDWSTHQMILRSGSPLRLDHLNRVDYLHASAIVLPARDRNSGYSASQSDNAAIKTILSISHSMRLMEPGQTLPLLVTELYDARKIPVALHSYAGPIEVVAGDEVASSMLAQMLHNPQISQVYRELLSHAMGNEIFARDCPAALVGRQFWDLAATLPAAILIGVTRAGDGVAQPFLNPPSDFTLAAGDKLVAIARRWEDVLPRSLGRLAGWPAPKGRLTRLARGNQRILIVGWSRRVPALLCEFESYASQRHSVTIASRVPPADRQRRIEHYGVALEHTTVVQLDTDFTIPERMCALKPESFDVILCLASDLSETDQEADARTLVAYAILKDLFGKLTQPPRLIVELLDELNVALVQQEVSEYLLTPHILSHILVQVALRRELNAVFRDLFSSGSKEILFRDFARYGVEPGRHLTFAEIAALARSQGEIALGIHRFEESANPLGGVHLNPDRREAWTLHPQDQIVVLIG